VKPISGLVDVLVPTYEHEEYIEECINSVFAQDYNNFIVHVFDDNSRDNTFDRLSKLQAKWGTRMRVYRNIQRLGNGEESILHHAPNLTGEFWALVEGDDFWLTPNKLTQQVSLLNSNPQAVAIASKTEMQNINAGKISVIEPDVSQWNYWDLILNAKRSRHYVHISSILWRNSYPDQNIPWPVEYLESATLKGEVMLMHEILKDTGSSVILLDKVTSVYRVTGNGVWSSLTEDEKLGFNARLNSAILGRRPAWVKLVMRAGLSKILSHKCLN
jgi:glycosyltransferase involved in cell wall biosynthesis